MHVTIAGGHGQIALLLGEQLAEQGHDVAGLIRDPEQAVDLEEVGIEPVTLDLETADPEAIVQAIKRSDAVVFAAGAGPGSGPERKWTVDYGAASKLIAAAADVGVSRYIMISAMGTDDPPMDDAVFSVYLRAKAKADAELMESDLDWTVVRPGRLTDDDPTGQVKLARHVPRGEIPRADVAAVVAACLTREESVGKVFEVVGGNTTILEALSVLSV